MNQIRRQVTIISIFLLVVGVSVLRASSAVDQLAGHWEAEMTGEGKSWVFLFDFKTSGNALTGTVGISTLDREYPISDGKISGNEVSFKGIGDWTGRLDGNELKLTRELDGGKKQQMKAYRKSSK